MLSDASDETDSFSSHSKNADEKAGEDGLKTQGDERCTGHDESHRVSVIQMAKTGQPPLPDCSQQQTAPREHREGCHDQSFFQIHDFEKAFQLPVWRKESLGNGKCLGEDGKENPLVAAQDGQAGEQQRMSVEACYARCSDLAWPQDNQAGQKR